MIIKAEADTNIYTLLRQIYNAKVEDITVYFSKDNELYQNAVNLRVLKKLAANKGKEIKYSAENPAHKAFIDSANNGLVEFGEEEIELEDMMPLQTPARKINPLGFLGMLPWIKSKDGEAAISGNSAESISVSSTALVGKKRLIKPIIIAAIALLLLPSSAFALWWYVPTAVINIQLDTKVLIKLVDVKAIVGQSDISVENSTIPAFKVEVTESDSQTIPTTGTKEVGEKAKGEVTLINKTSNDIEIKKGTTLSLISSDKKNIRFKTTEDVKVDKASDPNDSATYGRKKVKVEAENFGDAYNLDDKENFEIDDEDTDDIIGENEGDISGGTLENVNVVAQADIDSLKKSAEDFMKQKVEASLVQKVVPGQELQESSIEFKTVAAQYDKALDEEADELTLNITMSGAGIAYDSNMLREIVNELVRDFVPEQFDLSDDAKIDYEVAPTRNADGNSLNLQVKINSTLTPKLNEDKLKEDLSGMTIGEAQDYLDKIPDKRGFEIIVSPNMPEWMMRIPPRPQNISINIEK